MKTAVIAAIALFMVVSFCQVGYCADGSKNILKQGLLGAATGAIASSASGGKAGKGALIGAGVNVVGGALLDTITGEPVEKVENVQQMDSTNAFQQGYQAGFQNGHQNGYNQGYNEGFRAGVESITKK